MTCVHLRQLYQLCQQQGLRLSGSDLIHIVCEQCGVQEECPAVLMDEYDAKHGREQPSPPPPPSPPNSPR
jgi:hypothetical protein